MDLPLACTLGPGDGPARLRRWRHLGDTAAPTARRAGHRLQVRYHPGPGVHQELEALAAAEQECCPFVTWAVTEDDGHPVLHVTTHPDTPRISPPSPGSSEPPEPSHSPVTPQPILLRVLGCPQGRSVLRRARHRAIDGCMSCALRLA